MAAVLIGDIVQDALGILGEVLGPGVQAYGEPRMIKDAGRAFNLIFKKRWWEQYTDWTTITLDGTTGKATTNDFTQVLDFEDFASVNPNKTEFSLPTLPPTRNPSIVTGTRGLFYTSIKAGDSDYAAKKIKILPATTIGLFDIRARFHPLTAGDNWALTTSVHFDRDLLACGTAFMALSGDDLNPGAKADVQDMMDIKYKDIERALSTQETSMSARRSHVPSQWYPAV